MIDLLIWVLVMALVLGLLIWVIRMLLSIFVGGLPAPRFR